jgi:M6 family metalloprotease-like protein
MPRTPSRTAWISALRWAAPLFIILGSLALSPGASIGPSYPRSRVGRFEVDGFDFRPEGAWRRGADLIRANRRALLRRGQLRALNAGRRSAVSVTGTFYVPVVPIAFQNVAPPFPSADYAQVFFSPTPAPLPYSVRTYYAEASRGQVTIDGVVRDWIVADSIDTYYEDGCNGIGVLNSCPHGGRRLGELLIEALRKADTGALDWGQFDNDGPDGVPNSGDDDGVVDFVTFLQPEVDGACGTSNLWAHRYDIAAWNGGSGFVTTSPVRDAAGQPIPGRFIQVRDYTLQSGVGGPGACGAGAIMPMGTVAHETGHAFGLPDLYDTDLQSASVTQGVGEWSIMGSGNYTQPYSPSRFDAWSLAELGWISVDSLATEGRVTVNPVAISDTVLYLGVPGTDEYFLLENRQAIGSDTAQINPDCRFGMRICAKGPGLLVWHIDAGQIAAHGFRQDNRVNAGPIHGVALVQADGLNQLGQPGGKNRGDAGDPWPGSSGNLLFGPETRPPALDNSGATAGFELDSIQQVIGGGAVQFLARHVPPGQALVTLGIATDALLGQTTLGSAQITILDSLGNHNGRYDTGDFLAYYEAHPFALRAAPGAHP